MRSGQTQYFPARKSFIVELFDKRSLSNFMVQAAGVGSVDFNLMPDIELEPLDRLHNKLGECEQIKISYVIDGYLASLCTMVSVAPEGDEAVFTARGETIQEALIALDKLIPKDWSREQYFLTRAESREHVREPVTL